MSSSSRSSSSSLLSSFSSLSSSSPPFPSPSPSPSPSHGSSQVPLLKSPIRLHTLEAIRPSLLLRLLEPFGDQLAPYRAAIAQDHMKGAAALHQALCRVDSVVPRALRQALLAIGDLATERGHDQILSLARAAGVHLANDDQLTPSELAVLAYLDHRHLFELGHTRVEAAAAQRFIDFQGGDAQLDDALAATKRAQLESELGAWFATRNRTAYCDVVASESGDEVIFSIVHGRPPRAHGVIEPVGRDLVAYVPDKQDVVVFHRRTRVLSVHAQFPVEQDCYRRAFGRTFFGDEDHFRGEPVYTGQPLVDHGLDALAPVGPGLRAVHLRLLEVTTTDGPPVALRATSSGARSGHEGSRTGLGGWLRSAVGRAVLASGTVSHVKLAMEVDGHPRPLMVEIMPPNRLAFDRRVAPGAVREFLLARGFMRLAGNGYDDESMSRR